MCRPFASLPRDLISHQTYSGKQTFEVTNGSSRQIGALLKQALGDIVK